MWFAEDHAPNLVRADEEGSIWTSFERPKLGRFRRVLGMLREMARWIRAAVWAACGRISRIRVVGSARYGGRSAGVTGVNVGEIDGFEGEGRESCSWGCCLGMEMG